MDRDQGLQSHTNLQDFSSWVFFCFLFSTKCIYPKKECINKENTYIRDKGQNILFHVI